MRTMKRMMKAAVLTAVLAGAGGGTAMAQSAAAPNVAAALLVKLAAFDKGLSGDLTVYVMGDAAVAGALKKAVGSAIGTGTLKSVESGGGVPSSAPSILYVGGGADAAAATAYTRANKVLSATGDPSLLGQGGTLGIGVGADGKPSVSLNLTGSKAEGRSWNPAIMKIAKTVN